MPFLYNESRGVRGEVAEWTNAFDSKSKVPQNGIGGSNPSFSAMMQGSEYDTFKLQKGRGRKL